ncbi:HAMP domain-containing protein [Pseudoflavitalea sp. G-6-1-2]|uniref:ATP-binding protein n=1 Tax=Pseudoflavitalea sp. G-6-1-2 TaxID=2728841 RepID=UPI00146F3843|nr:ATP-binding protein [Pseudoflavitalea sp. G-6-1-2]NML19577.1 HAMP domain-containing protein [Pseudoflavitalea sp. G-6-1-2]
MRLKTKLTLGIGFLFLVIVIFGAFGLISIHRLKEDSDKVLRNNYETLVYNNNMLKALEQLRTDSLAMRLFENNLEQQEKNVTEPGEKEGTLQLRQSFEKLRLNKNDDLAKAGIRQSIQLINDLNQEAILRKNQLARERTGSAATWMTIIFTILALLAFTLVVNFPGVISNPIRQLAAGISAIANKNYSRRIHLSQKDEFGDLANAFNVMAEKLDEYEHSNLARIKFEKSRIEAVINNMRDAIIGFDEKKQILFMNSVAESLIGIRERDVVGKYGPDIAIRNDLMRTLLQDEVRPELEIFADGKKSYFVNERIEVRNEDARIGEVIVLRNITPFHELDEAKTNFIATVSHELKTPISSIKMSARLLDDPRVGNMNKEQQELLHSIKDDADRLLKITSELLNMSQVETGNIQLKLQSSPPDEIVTQAVQAVLFQAQQKQLHLKTSIQSSLPHVMADIEKTSWVMINFLTNAIRYAPESSSIEVEAVLKNDKVSFSVRDHGIGIDEKYLTKIFDRYYKVPGNYEKSGTGLGLAISREFIEAQGGNIWVESRIGEGSRFGFDFPVVAG